MEAGILLLIVVAGFFVAGVLLLKAAFDAIGRAFKRRRAKAVHPAGTTLTADDVQRLTGMSPEAAEEYAAFINEREAEVGR